MTKRAAAPNSDRSKKGGNPMGYTSYGFLGKVNDRLIEVVSLEELYELLDDGDETE